MPVPNMSETQAPTPRTRVTDFAGVNCDWASFPGQLDSAILKAADIHNVDMTEDAEPEERHLTYDSQEVGVFGAYMSRDIKSRVRPSP